MTLMLSFSNASQFVKIVTTIYVTAGFQTSDWFLNRSTGSKTGQVNFKSVRYTQSQKASQKAGQ